MGAAGRIIIYYIISSAYGRPACHLFVACTIACGAAPVAGPFASLSIHQGPVVHQYNSSLSVNIIYIYIYFTTNRPQVFGARWSITRKHAFSVEYGIHIYINRKKINRLGDYYLYLFFGGLHYTAAAAHSHRRRLPANVGRVQLLS